MRVALKELESISFDIACSDALKNLHSDLELLKEKYLKNTSTEEGIVLRQHASSNERARKLKLKYKRLKQRTSPYNSLELHQHHPGRPKSDYRYRNRFGRKAAKLRKV